MLKIEYFTRNKYLLADGDGVRPPAINKSVNLNWWHIKYGQNVQNLGDMLSPVVVDFMCGYYGIDIHKKIKKTINLYAIGSILFFENQDAVIWGSGSKNKLQKNIYNIIHQKYMRKLDVRCVRGPKTREVLLNVGIKCPMIYGDPAMLMPLIYTPKINKHNKYVIIRHMGDEKKENISNRNDLIELQIKTDNWQNAIDVIASSKGVISSSLHGIILAESYGIPAVLLKPHKETDMFKYEDYYFGTGRMDYYVCESIKNALNINFEEIHLPNVIDIQKRLVETFPVDIFR